MINHKHYSSLTAALLLSILGWTTVSRAEQVQPKLAQSQVSSAPSAVDSPTSSTLRSSSVAPEPIQSDAGDQIEETASATAESAGSQPTDAQSTDAQSTRKVGDYASSQSKASSATEIAKVSIHSLNNKSAATLYVRNIPVLTFLGESKATSTSIKPDTREPISQAPNDFSHKACCFWTSFQRSASGMSQIARQRV